MNIQGIEITDVIIFPVKLTKEQIVEGSKLKAFCRIIINDALIIAGVRIYESEDGSPWIKWPQEIIQDKDRSYDLIFPVTSELRAYIADQVLSQYSLITKETT